MFMKKRNTRTILVFVLGTLVNILIMYIRCTRPELPVSASEVIFVVPLFSLPLLSFLFFETGKKTASIIFSLFLFSKGLMVLSLLPKVLGLSHGSQIKYDYLVVIIMAASFLIPAITWFIYVIRDGREHIISRIITFISVVVCLMFQLDIVYYGLRLIMGPDAFYASFESVFSYSITSTIMTIGRPGYRYYYYPILCALYTIILTIGMFSKERLLGIVPKKTVNTINQDGNFDLEKEYGQADVEMLKK